VSLCLASAGAVKSLSIAAFMLAWTHSVEKTEWQEDWRVTPNGLEILQARVKGSGAGMEPPDDARLIDGWYRWRPKRPLLPELVLGNSGMAGEWRLCTDGQCQTLSDVLGHPIGVNVTILRACKPEIAAPPVALDANALLMRAISFRANGDRPKALADLDAALRLEPNLEAARAERKSLFHEIELQGAKMPMRQR
jgi:hypothetical protein